MRRNILIIGLVLMVVGGGIAFAGSYSLTKNATISPSMNEMSPGMYVTPIIMTNGTASLIVSEVGANSGLIKAADLSIVNSSNLKSIAIPANVSVSSSNYYEGISGSFYYIQFSSTSPNIGYVLIHGNIYEYSALSLAILGGVIMFIAGIVIAIIGAILKKKEPPFQDLLNL